GSGATGVVRIKAVSGDAVVFGNGSRQPLDAFCSAILNKHPDGYLLQSALNPHPVCAEVTGEHTGCVRIVTVHDGGTPRPVYALWKIPAPESATDNAHQSGAMLAKIDLSNGKILACRTGTGLEVREITHHPVSGAQIVGRTLPHWDDVTSLAENAHALFPEFGLFGFDIAICADGPKIVDCSETPCHQLYQLATGRGISNRDLAPVWEKVVSWQKAQSARNMSHIGRERCIEA
ncbi:MAG: sugar-transfer associated ATP-grasp domain-containing protein, partial [Roseobacter sp.]